MSSTIRLRTQPPGGSSSAHGSARGPARCRVVMSALANVIELPVRQDFDERDSLEHDLVLALATADDLASGMDAVVGRIRRDSGAARAEWWAKDEDGVFELVAAPGSLAVRCHSLPLGPCRCLRSPRWHLSSRQVESALMSLAPIIRRRAAEERLARTTIQLARRNEALEDFAALVAHELKTPLAAALVADDPSRPVEDALYLVDALLEARGADRARGRSPLSRSASSRPSTISGVEVEITADLATTLPLPAGRAPRDPAQPALERRRRRRRARSRDRGAVVALVAAARRRRRRRSRGGRSLRRGQRARSVALPPHRRPLRRRARVGSAALRRHARDSRVRRGDADDQRPDRRRSRAPAGGTAQPARARARDRRRRRSGHGRTGGRHGAAGFSRI